jgi:hypothetical protein
MNRSYRRTSVISSPVVVGRPLRRYQVSALWQ